MLTAFSPVVSVVPVYASSTEDGYGSSITMDPDSIQIDGQDDGIVIDSSGDDASGITVIGEDDNGSEGDGGIQIDGEDSGDSGDGIQIDEEEPDDGIDIGETEPDDGISISDEDITIVDVDPWEGISDVEDFSSDEYTSDVPNMCEFDIDLRSVHGYVKLTSNDDSDDVKFIRVAESEDGYKAVVRNIDDEIIYDNRLDDTAGIPWSEFVLSGKTYDVEVTADEGYVVTGFDIVRFADNNSNDETDFYQV